LNKLKVGELVWITHDAQKMVRNEEIATKGIVVTPIHGDWYRVYMSWEKKTRVVDFPRHMLEKIEAPDVEKG
jgi:hypothetical protein